MLLEYVLPRLNERSLAIVALAIVGAFLAILVAKPALLPQKTNQLLSKAIHIYLCRRYPIRSQDGRYSLPTSPYKWPNGQGDVGKFLEGIKNSSLWEKSHGHIYRIWSGMSSEVVLTRPEHLQAVFSDSDKHSKAVNNNSGYLMGQLLGQCVGLLSGRNWQSVRRVSEIPFLHQNMENYIPSIQVHVENHFASLEQQNNLRSNLIHPAEDLKLLPFWIVTGIFYGELSPDLKEQLRTIIPLREELFKHVIRGGISRFSWTRFLPTEAMKALAAFKKEWQLFNKTAYEHALVSRSPTPIVPMFEAAIQGTITYEQLYQTLDEALFANLDVTTGAISWNPVFLAAHPDCQERLRAEVLSTTPAHFHKFLLSSSSYLAMCISESSRLKPLAAFSVPQSAPTDRIVGGYVIPAGTNFIVDSYALNVRSEYWGPDATVYRPDRFLETNAIKSRYHFWRFGFGPRQCMGKYVADLIIRTLLAHLVMEYRLSLIETGTPWAHNAESWITHPDLLLRCEKREKRKETEVPEAPVRPRESKLDC